LCEPPNDKYAAFDVLDEVTRYNMSPCTPDLLPVMDNADAEPAGVHLLAHQATASFFFRRVEAFGFAADGFCSGAPASDCCASRRRVRRAGRTGSGTSARTSVTWQVRLRTLFTRPRARARQRLRVGPSSA